jgi:hypothetical protein
MQSPKRSPSREARIHDEIIVDAYGGSEQAMGWYYYLVDRLHFFSFAARCVTERAISPLRTGEAVTVLAMAPEEECEHEMFVRVQWRDRSVAVPLAQLQAEGADRETRLPIEDWHYWVGQGYEF